MGIAAQPTGPGPPGIEDRHALAAQEMPEFGDHQHAILKGVVIPVNINIGDLARRQRQALAEVLAYLLRGVLVHRLDGRGHRGQAVVPYEGHRGGGKSGLFRHGADAQRQLLGALGLLTLLHQGIPRHVLAVSTTQEPTAIENHRP